MGNFISKYGKEIVVSIATTTTLALLMLTFRSVKDAIFYSRHEFAFDYPHEMA